MRRWHYYALTLLFLVGMIALDLSLVLRPEALRHRLDEMLAANLKTPVVYESIDVEVGGVVRVEGIRVLASEGSTEKLFEARTVTVELDWLDLLTGELNIKAVRLDAPVLHLYWDASGELKTPSFLVSPDTKVRSSSIPAVSVSGLSLVSSNTPYVRAGEVVRLRGIDAELVPTRSRVFAYTIDGVVNDPLLGRFSVTGSFGEAYLRGVVRRPGFRIDGSSDLVGLLEDPLRDVLRRLSMKGVADLEIKLDSTDFHHWVDITGDVRMSDVGLGFEGWPDEIKRLKGTVHYSNGQLTCEDANFELAGGHVSVDEARVDLDGERVDYLVRGKMTGLFLGQSFAARLDSYPDPGPTIREVLDALSAEGTVDVGFRLSPDHEKERVDVDCNVTFREASLSYAGFVAEDGTNDGFPYPLERVIGDVRITNDNAVFHDIRSLMKLPDVKASGEVVWGEHVGAGFDIKITGSTIQLDERIADCLSPADRAIYDAFDPEGQVGFELNLHRDETEIAEAEIQLTVMLAGVQTRCKWFPYLLEDAEGDLLFGSEGGCKINGVRARHGSGVIQVSGDVDFSEGPDSVFDIQVDSTGLFVDQELLDALATVDPGAAAAIDPFNLRGEIDVDARIRSSAEGISNDVHVRMRDGSFSHREFPEVRFTGVNGDLLVNDDHLQLQGVEMSWQGNDFNAHGTAFIQGDGGHDIHLTASSLKLTPETMDVAQGMFSTLSVFDEGVTAEGAAYLDLHFLALKEKRDGTKVEDVKVNIRPLNVTFRGSDPYFCIEHVTGDVEIIQQQAHFRNLVGEYVTGVEEGSARATISVVGGVLEFGPREDLYLTDVKIQNLPLSDSVVALLPKEIAEGLGALDLEGSLSAELDVVELASGNLLVTGNVSPLNLNLKPMGIEIIGAALDLEKLRLDADGFALHGNMGGATLRLSDVEIKELSASVHCESGEMVFEEIGGLIHGGDVNKEDTRIRVELGEGAPFTAEVSVTDARLDSILSTSNDEAGRGPRGLVNLRGELGGRLADFRTWTGSGELNLSGEDLYELPFFAVVLNILNLDFLGGSAQTGEVSYRIENSQIQLERARFEGPGVNLDGNGVIGFDGLCDITFDIEALKVLEGIPILGRLISLGRGLFVDAVRVQGPIEDLNASIENFLINADRDSGRRLKVKGLKLGARGDKEQK